MTDDHPPPLPIEVRYRRTSVQYVPLSEVREIAGTSVRAAVGFGLGGVLAGAALSTYLSGGVPADAGLEAVFWIAGTLGVVLVGVGLHAAVGARSKFSQLSQHLDTDVTVSVTPTVGRDERPATPTSPESAATRTRNPGGDPE